MQVVAGYPMYPNCWRFRATALCGFCGQQFHLEALWSIDTLKLSHSVMESPPGACLSFAHPLGYVVAVNQHICPSFTDPPEDPFYWMDWRR